ncbi:uncharacterized protein LOC123262864 [Cotesia glomerata]|uniref:Peptidase S1 domain-containing protein n=1 Tax=Cotesia glomerata TaxID=32391 RepID=A0AAV7IRJ8_COTGL|nr:uncharacterized protein LOC123262864 [Cotesia glomerata]XP_044581284.1 uncharacterized protein LOC123262864 [Cotesia glomerata]KAH0555330.1 hypothetical protein KQX54_017673 [Cotesia glomerata]
MLPVRLHLVFIVLEGTVFSNSRILGETREFRPEELWDHVWMVDLSLDRTEDNRKTLFHCVGALIHERAVLTSAMCLKRSLPLSKETKVYIFAEILDDSRQSTNQQIYAMENVTYHNFQKNYDAKKFDYGLVILYDRIIHDASSNSKSGKIIPVAKSSDFNDIDFRECLLTSITTRRKRKCQVDFECKMTSNVLDCKTKAGDGVLYDSGSPVICRRFTNHEWVLIGFISKYTRFVLETEREIDDEYDDEEEVEEKFIPIYTTIIPIGHGLTYEVIDRVMKTQYRVTPLRPSTHSGNTLGSES